MIEITFEELTIDPDRYFYAAADGERIIVTKNGMKLIMLQSIDYSILSEALQIAQLVINEQ